MDENDHINALWRARWSGSPIRKRKAVQAALRDGMPRFAVQEELGEPLDEYER